MHNKSLLRIKYVAINVDCTQAGLGDRYHSDWVQLNQKQYTGVEPSKVRAVIGIGCGLAGNGSVIGTIHMVPSSDSTNAGIFNIQGPYSGRYVCDFAVFYTG